MNYAIRAVPVREVGTQLRDPSSGAQTKSRVVRVADLPATEEIVPNATAHGQAVLSWRWDLDQRDGTSRNTSAAIAHAIDIGVEYLFIDKVSVDQSLRGRDLIEAVAAFSQLFGSIPTIAAYDTALAPDDYRHFLRTLRRPWIAKELLAMRYNPHKITYVGHVKDQGTDKDFGFRHMINRIWSTSFANSILYVLTGFCDMHDVSELPLIMPEHEPLLSAASNNMTREDALMTAAILSQTSTDDDRVNGDINIRDLNYQAYKFAQTEDSSGFWQNWNVLLNGEVVARWSEKDYTRDGMPRRKLSTSINAGEIFANELGVDVTPLSTGRPHESASGSADKRIEAIEVYDLSGRFGD
jgi:hypothetical protein